MAFFVLSAVIGTGLFFAWKGLAKLTSDRPAEIAISTPTDEQFNAAKTKLDQLREAIRSRKEVRVAFTAGDLNALIARDPEFREHRGRTRIEIDDSAATLELSVPLSGLPFPGLKNRWFNGSTRFGVAYDQDGFDFDPHWLEANGHHMRGRLMRAFASSFSESFTEGFESQVQKNSGVAFRERVKSMALEGEELIVVTRGEAATI